MTCRVCREAFAGIWDPERTPRIDDGDPKLEGVRNREWDAERGNSKPDENPRERTEVFNYRFRHHKDYASLKNSRMKEDCRVCLLLDELPTKLGETVVHRNFVTSFILLPRHICFFVGDVGIEHAFPYSLHKLEDCSSTHSSPERSTESPPTWACVKDWLQNCLASHNLCRQPDGFVPSRLLKLDSSGSEKRFSLVSKQDLDPAPRYIALSYCWGPQPAGEKFRLLQVNVDALSTGFPVSTLPKTFQDAFRIAEELGIDFLWIDRLCIIQDSSEDWLRESSQMQHVYSSSYITVCAHGAGDDSEGCFFTRNPSRVLPARLELEPGRPHILGENVVTWDGRFRSRVGGRGWVLQEQLLSQRTLYFGRDQVFWECRSATRCETYPKRVPICNMAGVVWAPPDRRQLLWKTPLSQALATQAWVPSHLANSSSDDAQALGYCLYEWEVTVNAYTRRRLTYASDKLVAIAGLAAQMEAKLRSLGAADDAYHAGIWAFSLPRGLLWDIARSPRRLAPARKQRAPSWSWAAVPDGWVDLYGHYVRSDAEVLVSGIRACTTSSNLPGEGMVVRGTLTMKGRLAVPVWDNAPDPYLGGKTMPLRRLRNARTAEEIEVAQGFIAFDDLFADWSEAELFCVPLVYDSMFFWRFGRTSGFQWARMGIVLRKGQVDQPKFVRVGFFAYVVSDDGQAREFFEGLSEGIVEVE